MKSVKLQPQFFGANITEASQTRKNISTSDIITLCLALNIRVTATGSGVQGLGSSPVGPGLGKRKHAGKLGVVDKSDHGEANVILEQIKIAGELAKSGVQNVLRSNQYEDAEDRAIIYESYQKNNVAPIWISGMNEPYRRFIMQLYPDNIAGQLWNLKAQFDFWADKLGAESFVFALPMFHGFSYQTANPNRTKWLNEYVRALEQIKAAIEADHPKATVVYDHHSYFGGGTGETALAQWTQQRRDDFEKSQRDNLMKWYLEAWDIRSTGGETYGMRTEWAIKDQAWGLGQSYFAARHLMSEFFSYHLLGHMGPRVYQILSGWLVQDVDAEPDTALFPGGTGLVQTEKGATPFLTPVGEMFKNLSAMLNKGVSMSIDRKGRLTVGSVYDGSGTIVAKCWLNDSHSDRKSEIVTVTESQSIEQFGEVFSLTGNKLIRKAEYSSKIGEKRSCGVAFFER